MVDAPGVVRTVVAIYTSSLQTPPGYALESGQGGFLFRERASVKKPAHVP